MCCSLEIERAHTYTAVLFADRSSHIYQMRLMPPVLPSKCQKRLPLCFIMFVHLPLLTRPSFSAASTHQSVARCGPSCCTTTATIPPLRKGKPGGCRNALNITTSSRGGGLGGDFLFYFLFFSCSKNPFALKVSDTGVCSARSNSS